MLRIVIFVIVVIVFILGLGFHLQNDHLVEFRFYTGAVEYPLSVFLVLAFITGTVCGVSAMLKLVIQLQARNRKLKKEMRLREQEVSNLRSIPYKQLNK